MKTPDEIKKDALALIRQTDASYRQLSKALCNKENATLDEVLQAIAQVNAELEAVKRERDELLSDLKNYGCYTCEHYECDDNEMPCANCKAFSLWERMGACLKNTEVQDGD